MLNEIQKRILEVVAGMKDGRAEGAVNIRVDGKREYRSDSPNIKITSKEDKDGIDIRVAPGTKGEQVHIPVVLTAAGFRDKVYNDFFIGEGAEVVIVAGCGVHSCAGCESRHDGVHTFYVGKNARVTYTETHYGEGETGGRQVLNPETVLYLEEGALVNLETTQLKGVDDTKRYTRAVVGKGAEIVITEKLLTHGSQRAQSEMDVFLNGEDSRTRVISRSVAKDGSEQIFYPRVEGNGPCFGHVSCDAIIMGEAKVKAIPAITCNHVDAGLIHEAAIGRIANDQIVKLMTLGLTAEEAEEKILEGFLR